MVPSRKVTVPVGVVEPDAGVTVAVKLMPVPLTAEVAEAERTVVVSTIGAFTVMTTGADVLPRKLVSPL